MKVLFVNAMHGRGGAAIALSRLMDALAAAGVEAELLLLERHAGDPRVIHNPRSYPFKHFLSALLDRLPVLLYSHRWDNFRNLSFSPAWRHSDSFPAIQASDADIVHLHWINHGHLCPESIGAIHQPVVWTGHDMWAFTGGCHHSDSCEKFRDMCGACPMLGSTKENDLSRRVWNRKHKSWARKAITLVCPSHWLADRAKVSSLFRDRKVVIIPNPLNLTHFAPRDRMAARRRLGLPHATQLIFFGANKALTNRAKGFHYLDSAMSRLSDQSSNRAELMIAGADDADRAHVTSGTRVHFLGYLNAEKMADAYAACNVFVLPSIRETLPNMVAEALACGRPVVAFDVGGISDMIQHGENGYLARPFEVEDLAHGLSTVLAQTGEAMSRRAREIAEALFSPAHVAARYIEVYKSAMTERL